MPKKNVEMWPLENPPKTQIFLAILNFDLAKSLILASQKKEKKRLLMALVFMNIT